MMCSLLLSLPIVVFCAAPQLVSHLSMENIVNSTVISETGSNNGILDGGTVVSPDGKFGGHSVAFRNASTDRINMGSLDFPPLGGYFAMWVFLNDISYEARLLSKASSYTVVSANFQAAFSVLNATAGYRSRITDGKITNYRFRVRLKHACTETERANDQNKCTKEFYAPETGVQAPSWFHGIPYQQWFHVAIGWNGRAVVFYVDEQLLTSIAFVNTYAPTDPVADLVIGNQPPQANDNRPMFGRVDEFFLFHVTSSDQELTGALVSSLASTTTTTTTRTTIGTTTLPTTPSTSASSSLSSSMTPTVTASSSSSTHPIITSTSSAITGSSESAPTSSLSYTNASSSTIVPPPAMSSSSASSSLVLGAGIGAAAVACIAIAVGVACLVRRRRSRDVGSNSPPPPSPHVIVSVPSSMQRPAAPNSEYSAAHFVDSASAATLGAMRDAGAGAGAGNDTPYAYIPTLSGTTVSSSSVTDSYGHGDFIAPDPLHYSNLPNNTPTTAIVYTPLK